MRKGNKYLVWILMAVVFCFCSLLSFLHLGTEREIIRKTREKEGFTVLCPNLAHCGDAFLLYDSQEAVMIDTGEKGDADILLDLMKAKGIDSLKALILTHYDKDHIGGAARILRETEVKKCYMTLGEEDSEEYDSLMKALEETGTEQIYVTAEEHFKALEAGFTIYPPRSYEFEKDEDNNRSLIIGVDAQADKLLFTGDAEKERMDQYLEAQYDGTAYTWLKVPHHGRDKGTVKKLLKKFKPQDAVICSSLDEPENDKVVELLKKEGVKVWLTRKDDAEFFVSSIPPAEREEAAEEGTTEKESRKAKTAKSKTSEEKTAEGKNSQKNTVKTPVFSRESGFYDKTFSLKLKAARGCKIYYTLDSSEPNDDSIAYDGPIKISDVSSNPNVYANRTDFRPYTQGNHSKFAQEVEPGWFTRDIIPDTVDKCQVVRAVAIDKKGRRSDVVTASYFVGFQNKKGYDSLPVLSLVSDPEDLFDDDKGIMVNGSKYKERLASGALNGIVDTHFIRKYCNTYFGRGIDWERKTHMDFFNEKRKDLVFSQEVGIRLHGNQSRVSQAQKSFNLYARKSYDGNSTFLVPFYEDGILQDKVTLMRGSDLRNYYLTEKMDNRAMDSQDYRMVQVFLDGEYWGLYAIQERYNSSEYLKTHYNLNKDEYILAKGTPVGFDIKNGDPEAIRTSFRIVRDYAKSHDLSDEANYKKLCSIIDVQSFIDGYAARVYLGDRDWSWFKNQYMLFYDHKWHWMIFDMDYGASMYNTVRPESNSFNLVFLNNNFSISNDPLFAYLKDNKDFRRQFVNTFLDLGNEIYNGEKCSKELETIKEKYRDAFRLQDERYPTTAFIEQGSDSDYVTALAETADRAITFFDGRLDYAARYAGEYFGLSGKTFQVTLENPKPEGGRIRINTITPTLGKDKSWTGIYYSDFPVTLFAEPEEGWTFAGWEREDGKLIKGEAAAAETVVRGRIQTQGIKTELSFDEDIKVKAVFKKK